MKEQYLYIFEDMGIQTKTEISDDDKTIVDAGYLTIVRQSDFKEWTCEGWTEISKS